ncbi:metallophosphoesterase [Phycisphaerales bacterium AB-hyl4]|uniref:Metallophosphoesterase n=1 Tax=Natronomicrosphaera hydrolytica TaxID=3242702 RepID=A0ABV4U5B1_9BACT
MARSLQIDRRGFLKGFSGALLGVAFVGHSPVAAVQRSVETTEGNGWKIALLADPHVSLREDHAAFRANFERVIEQVNAAEVDAVLMAGDCTTHGFAAGVEDFQEYISWLNVEKVWCTPGNHDIGNKPMPERSSHLSDRRVEQWEEVFGRSFYETQLVPGVRLVVANSSYMGMGLEGEPAQWAFLEEQLARPTDDFTVFMAHYPLFVREVDEEDAYFNIEPESRQRMLGLLKQGGVDLFVCGHTHNPRAFEHDGIPHVIAPAISFGLPHDRQPEGWTMLTIDPLGKVAHENQMLT